MDKFLELFEEYILKAITMTEKTIEADFKEINLENFAENRDRLLNVVDQISKKIDWEQVNETRRTELSRQIEFIKKLDDKLIEKMQAYQQELKLEIEKNFRQKENIKGYNLNDVK